jgi:hypothetical protein
MVRAPSDSILVVSATWRTRTLLVAQIAHLTDRNVLSTPGVNEALGLIRLRGIHPILIVVDAGQAIGPADVERLLGAIVDVRLVIVASRFPHRDLEGLRNRCAAYLIRPVTIGRVAQIVCRVLEELP